ncbi:MAG: hypothetical protein QM820_12685 [Minicystis sp.]
MRILRLASLLILPAGISLAGGCLPLKLFADSYDGAGGGGGATNEGGGGNHDVTMTNGILPGSSGSTGSGGAGGMLTPSYAYLCGGSQPECSPDPGSYDCAPGGSANMGVGPDAGSKLTCHLVSEDDHVVATCGLSGDAAEGDPCNQATDCQAGLGCSATAVTGICRQYCCGDAELCPKDTHCIKAAIAEGTAEVPLCMPVTPCELLNDAAWCDDGQICAIVRQDGTTSCVDPGDGHEGESCPCAAGYTCSNATGTCLKLCHVNGDECGTGTCQGGTAPYPDGIGYCVPQSSQ